MVENRKFRKGQFVPGLGLAAPTNQQMLLCSGIIESFNSFFTKKELSYFFMLPEAGVKGALHQRPDLVIKEAICPNVNKSVSRVVFELYHDIPSRTPKSQRLKQIDKVRTMVRLYSFLKFGFAVNYENLTTDLIDKRGHVETIKIGSAINQCVDYVRDQLDNMSPDHPRITYAVLPNASDMFVSSDVRKKKFWD